MSPKEGKTIFCLFSCVIVHAFSTLLMESVDPKGDNGAFSSSNDPQRRKNEILSIFVCYSPWIFGNLGFWLDFG
ncbi:hypothetical protein H5410_005428 [Solanum commersonii]|uniref:Uncharacterized protein n=1 Tax=Solanum commersonii TaxID=4109 RepID=A0A9J6A797_SOLCO|nr:hypothetical protein H5410_005428 [Solanum commersonii]